MQVKVLGKLRKFQQRHHDKIAHFVLSGLLTAIFSLLSGNPLLSGLATFVLGVSKEIYDTQKTNPTGFNFADLFADVGGIVVAVGVLVILL